MTTAPKAAGTDLADALTVLWSIKQYERAIALKESMRCPRVCICCGTRTQRPRSIMSKDDRIMFGRMVRFVGGSARIARNVCMRCADAHVRSRESRNVPLYIDSAVMSNRVAQALSDDDH